MNFCSFLLFLCHNLFFFLDNSSDSSELNLQFIEENPEEIY